MSTGLEYYNKKPNEPESSVMESLDYNFSVLRYPNGSPLKKFVDEYIIAVKNNLDINLFNCRFERPKIGSDYLNFLNFYIYLKGIDPLELGIFYVIDEEHDLKKIFYEILEKNKLPAVDKNTRIQFFIKDFEKNSRNFAISRACDDIHREIKVLYPDVLALSYWSCFYVFIDEDVYEKIITDTELLKEIKEYCYRAVKKHDKDNVWNRDNFYIRIDNHKIYKEIGGYNYFNSDYMDECMTI